MGAMVVEEVERWAAGKGAGLLRDDDPSDALAQLAAARQHQFAATGEPPHAELGRIGANYANTQERSTCGEWECMLSCT